MEIPSWTLGGGMGLGTCLGDSAIICSDNGGAVLLITSSLIATPP